MHLPGFLRCLRLGCDPGEKGSRVSRLTDSTAQRKNTRATRPYNGKNPDVAEGVQEKVFQNCVTICIWPELQFKHGLMESGG